MKRVEALTGIGKNLQRAIKLCTEDCEGLPGDISESLSLMQVEIVDLRDGIGDETRKKVEYEFNRLGSLSRSQLKADFLNTVTQGIYEAIELQFKAKF